MIKKILISVLLLTCLIPYTQELQINKYTLLSGSNIYVRIFLFYFPIAKTYDMYIYTTQDGFLILEIVINEKDIIQEPLTPSYFESNLSFIIKKIPNTSNETRLNLTIKCNKKFIQKKARFTVYKNKDFLIVKGNINDLKIREITQKEYFKNRLNWTLPIYFDLRLKIDEDR